MRNYQMILGAKRFLGDYFGFDMRFLTIHGLKQDKEGNFLMIQFSVNAPALDEPHVYVAAWRRDLSDWELILLPNPDIRIH